MDSQGGQSFRNSVHKGVDLKVFNLKPYAITWGDMFDLVKGLREECWLQTCEFEFSIGSGLRIGGGGVVCCVMILQGVPSSSDVNEVPQSREILARAALCCDRPVR